APRIGSYVLNRCSAIDKIFALSREQKMRIIESFSIAPQKVDVLGAGVRDDIFALPTSPYRSSHYIELVYVGKLSNAKGVPWLLEAFQNVQSYSQKPTRLTLVGSGLGAEAEALYAQGSVMGENVHFLGTLSQVELAKVLSESHILVLPSFFEGL